MKKTTSEVIDELTLAEAAAWLTRLQESERAPALEAAFKEWLAAEPAHARAFTRVNDTWELLPGAVASVRQSPSPRRHRVRARRPWLAAAACAVVLLAAVGVVRKLIPSDRAYETAIGGQRTVVLDDNTRVVLNTDTRIVVEYRKSERRILLERGEALFHVTRNPSRPFVVQTGAEQIVDLGTVYDVRREKGGVAVTLLEGKVWVGAQSSSPDQPAPSFVLAPGERLTLSNEGASVLDRPDIQSAMAWRRGQVYFDDTTLAVAVAELSRYGGTPIHIAAPDIASLRVSGVFSVRDHAEFVSAIASLHNLRTEYRDGAIVLDR